MAGINQNGHRLLFSSIIISLGSHIVLFTILCASPVMQTSGAKLRPNIINVDLVSVAQQPRTASSKNSTAVTKQVAPAPPPKKSTVTPYKKPVEKQTKWKSKKSLKKKTIKPDTLKKTAISRIKKKVEQTQSDPLSQALSRLQEKVAKEAPSRHAQPSPGSGTGSALTPQGVSSGALATQFEIYKAEIAYLIGKNWSFPPALAMGMKNLETHIGIRIMANGEVKKIWFEKESPNRNLNEQAYRAVMKSNPLPSLPEGIGVYHDLVLRFTESGLN